MHCPRIVLVTFNLLHCRSMGLRQLTIVDESNHVRGIITRKDLMGYRLDEAVRKGDGLQGVSVAQ